MGGVPAKSEISFSTFGGVLRCPDCAVAGNGYSNPEQGD